MHLGVKVLAVALLLADAAAAQVSAPQAPAPPAAAPARPAETPVPVPAPTPVQPGWVTRGTAELQVLDKVNARAATVSVPVGQSVRYGSIDLAVQACASRPPDQAPDSAAFLVITDSRPGATGFRGWMFAANPTISILEHPIYDVRVLSCR